MKEKKGSHCVWHLRKQLLETRVVVKTELGGVVLYQFVHFWLAHPRNCHPGAHVEVILIGKGKERVGPSLFPEVVSPPISFR